MSTIADTRPGGWRAGWFLDCAPKGFVLLSTGGGDAAGGYYFEATLNYIGGGAATGYTASNTDSLVGFADPTAPLYSIITNASNALSVPTHAMFATFPGYPSNSGVDHCSGVQGNVIGFAINTSSKKIWSTNITSGAGRWNPSLSLPQDPGAGTGGISYSGTLTGSISLIAGGYSAQGTMPAPAAPTLTSIASPGAPGGTVYVRVAYINAGGGGIASLAQSITLAANTAVHVASPAAPAYGTIGAGGYTVYAGASASTCVLQNLGGVHGTIGDGGFDCAGTLVTGTAQAPYSTITINTGGSAFSGSLPTGFAAWGASDHLDPSNNSNLVLSNGNLTVSTEGISFIAVDFTANIVRDILKKAN